ncbi:hypothetical protein JCGZ_13212 [Jatropha curcas]|uniref:Uncharacterized protein n=1 Tax=Jatropha curcas TaxID=180498 RepID=A0A067K876_JATCU|nr:hypothetical protein JCGZ_13212 [Jatropha curcas]
MARGRGVDSDPPGSRPHAGHGRRHSTHGRRGVIPPLPHPPSNTPGSSSSVQLPMPPHTPSIPTSSSLFIGSVKSSSAS